MWSLIEEYILSKNTVQQIQVKGVKLITNFKVRNWSLQPILRKFISKLAKCNLEPKVAKIYFSNIDHKFMVLF